MSTYSCLYSTFFNSLIIEIYGYLTQCLSFDNFNFDFNLILQFIQNRKLSKREANLLELKRSKFGISLESIKVSTLKGYCACWSTAVNYSITLYCVSYYGKWQKLQLLVLCKFIRMLCQWKAISGSERLKCWHRKIIFDDSKFFDGRQYVFPFNIAATILFFERIYIIYYLLL